MISQLMQQPISFLEPAAENIGNMANDSLVSSKKNFFVRKCCYYSVKPIVGKTPILTNKNSAAMV